MFEMKGREGAGPSEELISKIIQMSLELWSLHVWTFFLLHYHHILATYAHPHYYVSTIFFNKSVTSKK